MPRRILLLFVALLIAATATVLTQRWLGARLAGAAVAAPVTVEVLVAATVVELLVDGVSVVLVARTLTPKVA